MLVVDDHVDDRDAVALLLDAAEDLAVAGVCDHAEAERSVAAVGPAVVLLDADLRSGIGRRRLKAILSISARARVVVLTEVADPVAVLETLAAGGSGYLLKTGSGARLVHAIHDVVDGRVPISPTLLASMREHLTRSVSFSASAGAKSESLTRRELTVLSHLAAGRTNAQIARELVLSPGTVKLHVQHVIAKLGVANRTQAAVYAARSGLVAGS